MMKKVLSLFIVTVFLFNIVSVRSFAVSTDNTGDGKYTVLDFWNDFYRRLQATGNSHFTPETNLFNPDVSPENWWDSLVEYSFGEDGLISNIPPDGMNAFGTAAEDLANWVGDMFTPWWIKNKGTGVVNVPDDINLQNYEYYFESYYESSVNGITTPSSDIIELQYFNGTNYSKGQIVFESYLGHDYYFIKIDSISGNKLYYISNGSTTLYQRGFTSIKKTLGSFISTNFPITYPDDYTGERITPTEPPSHQSLDIRTLTPDEWDDFLEELDRQIQIYISLQYPDLTTIQGLLENIRAILADGANKGITADDLQSLADSLGCQCPPPEIINAAIMTLIGEDQKNFSDVVNVLLDIKDGEKGINEIYDQLKKMNTESNFETNVDNFFVAIDPLDTEFAEKFPDVVDSIMNLISQFRGIGEFYTISTLITTYQSILLNPSYDASDISINLSFLGVNEPVVILSAADFQSGGRMFEAAQIGKQLVTIFIVIAWLHLMRRRYLIMMERAAN
jgi:hypothetical protein